MKISDNELKNDIIIPKTLEELRNDKLSDRFMESAKNFLENKKNGEIRMSDLAVVDRIEGNYAVCELLDGTIVDISIERFKEKPLEGDIFNIELIFKSGKVQYNIGEKNIVEMENRRKLILEKLNKIRNKET
jgi:hypothetical protein